jgi:hypothetical protein
MKPPCPNSFSRFFSVVKDLPPGPIARDDDGERATPFHVSIATAT